MRSFVKVIKFSLIFFRIVFSFRFLFVTSIKLLMLIFCSKLVNALELIN